MFNMTFTSQLQISIIFVHLDSRQEKQSEIKRFEQKFKTAEKTMQDMKDKFE